VAASRSGPANGREPRRHSPEYSRRSKRSDTFGDNFTFSGFRSPVIVISPFAKSGFVSHTPMDYTAILKFIETRFGLPTLTQRDAAQPDMSEFFDLAGAHERGIASGST
jgi:phospholipase C